MADYNERVIARLTYHIGWATYKRQDVLSKAVCAHLEKFLVEKCLAYGIIIGKIHARSRFVYVSAQCPPKEAPAKVVQLLKGASSRVLRADYPHLFEPPLSESLWERGYYIATTGEFCGDELRKFLGLPPASVRRV